MMHLGISSPIECSITLQSNICTVKWALGPQATCLHTTFIAFTVHCMSGLRGGGGGAKETFPAAGLPPPSLHRISSGNSQHLSTGHRLTTSCGRLAVTHQQ